MRIDPILRRAGLRAVGSPDGSEVWRCRLDVEAGELAALGTLLSPGENARAAGYGTPGLRDLFVVRRGLLRLLLSVHVGEDPACIEISERPGAKPALVSGKLHFNLSFSGPRALFAFSFDRGVGVDLEAIDPGFPTEGVACDHFTAAERRMLHEAAPDDRMRLFFTFWTRKEACAKALGIGLTDSFSCYEVPVPLAPVSEPLAVYDGGRLDERLTVFDLDVGEGLCGALAVWN